MIGFLPWTIPPACMEMLCSTIALNYTTSLYGDVVLYCCPELYHQLVWRCWTMLLNYTIPPANREMLTRVTICKRSVWCLRVGTASKSLRHDRPQFTDQCHGIFLHDLLSTHDLLSIPTMLLKHFLSLIADVEPPLPDWTTCNYYHIHTVCKFTFFLLSSRIKQLNTAWGSHVTCYDHYIFNMKSLREVKSPLILNIEWL